VGLKLTVLINDQHPRLASSLLLLHNVRDGIFAVGIKGNVNLTALVVNGSDY
jgi:hypothetical protein